MPQHSSDRSQIIAHPLAEFAPPSTGFHHVDVREILRILRRHVRLIAITTAVLMALALVFVAVVTPLYSATATVLIDPRRSSVLDNSNGNSSNSSGNFGTDDASIESQVSLIQSLAVMQRVVDSMKLADDPEFSPPAGVLDWIRSPFAQGGRSGLDPKEIARARAMDTLQRRLKILRQKATFLVDITASSIDRDKAANIANATAQAYFLEQVRSRYDATKIAAGWLNQQLDELKSRVIASDKAVQDFRANNNLVITQGVTINDQQMSDLNTKLIEARTDAAEARAKFEQVDRIAKGGRDSGALTEALGSDTIARLRQQYADLVKTEADLSTKFGARHPQIVTVRNQLRETKQLIDEEIRRILQARRHTYEVATAREASLQKSLDNLANISGDSGGAQVRLRELQREADANRTLYESFLARYKEANAQESLELPDSRIVTRADPPISISFPKVTLTLGLALLIGLFLGCLIALVADYLDQRIKTFGQAKASGLPSIAALPNVSVRELASLTKQGRADLDRYDPKATRLLPAGLQPPLLRYAITQPMSQFAEAVRSIRFALQHVARTRNTQVVSITSAIGGEGKSTLASNLAMSLSTVGVKTLLVEGDLRNPQLSRSLCPGVRSGLIEVALTGMPLHQGILVDPGSRLAFLPAPLPKDVALLTEFASSEGMSDVLRELRNHFDVIVVDSPPLLPLVDGRALAELADSIILTVGWDRTPEDMLFRAVDLLTPVHDRIIGTVLTRVDFERFKYYEPYDSNAYGSTYVQPSLLRQESAR